eukprot:COSAG05_NODE_18762_length_303_cov_0.980392_1_plen_89_part_10
MNGANDDDDDDDNTKFQRRTELRSRFEQLDKDGDGRLNEEEVVSLLAGAETSINAAEIKRVVGTLGQVSFEEFEELWAIVTHQAQGGSA